STIATSTLSLHDALPISALPLASVLTLPATGSEMNNGAVITRLADKAKLPMHSDLVFPQFSVLDPTKTFSLPARQVGNGVVDSRSEEHTSELQSRENLVC